jgi:voltage-gated potassium channel
MNGKLKSIISPTWALANYLKGKQERKSDKSNLIIKFNSLYFIISIASVAFVWVCQVILKDFQSGWLYYKLHICLVVLWSYFLISRANEVFIAFLNDAFDKMDISVESKSDLTPKQRIKLSLKSYIELVINFSLIYSLLPREYWKQCDGPKWIVEAIYFSGITITTTGYGDIAPCHWYPQILSIYEVFCGTILLVVCFAIYASRLGAKDNKENK